jgi:hypothetical protein
MPSWPYPDGAGNQELCWRGPAAISVPCRSQQNSQWIRSTGDDGRVCIGNNRASVTVRPSPSLPPTFEAATTTALVLARLFTLNTETRFGNAIVFAEGHC